MHGTHFKILLNWFLGRIRPDSSARDRGRDGGRKMPRIQNGGGSGGLPQIITDVTRVTFPGQVIPYDLVVRPGFDNDTRQLVPSTFVLAFDGLTRAPLTLVGGDIDHDSVLDVDEVWTFHGSFTVTQQVFDGINVEISASISGVQQGDPYFAFATQTLPIDKAFVARDLAYWRDHPEAWQPFMLPVGFLPMLPESDFAMTGVWLGDTNRTGVAPDDLEALFVPIDAIRSLLASSGKGDVRELVLAQTIVAQFNVYAGAELAGRSLLPVGGPSDGLAGDLISEAIQFLQNNGVDSGRYRDLLDTGVGSDFEFNLKTDKLVSPKLSIGSTEWKSVTTYHSEHYGDFKATGQGFLSALQAFNTNRLVVTEQGMVGWNASAAPGGALTNLGLNGIDDYWRVLHELTTGKGLFEGIL